MDKLCVFAGTTEGRELVEFLCGQPAEITACVATEYGQTLLEPAEKELFAALQKAEKELSGPAAEDFRAQLRVLASFAAPLARFFTDVMVNAEDTAVRQNRLALLTRVRALFTQGTADITKL